MAERNRQKHSRREFLGVLAGVGVTSAAFRAWCAEHGANFDFSSVAAECGWVWLLPQRKRVGGESPTLKKSNKFFVGLWLLCVWSHAASQKGKIPVATIGRSLSGGVTVQKESV